MTFNGAETWSSLYNQPTAEFYHITTDNQMPYRAYGAQQDNSTITVPSRSRLAAITMADSYEVGGGESGYIAVHPDDPNIVYAGTQNEGIFKSTDYGDTWAAAGGGLTGAITYLTPDPTRSGRLFASTANAFYLSEDGGATWSNVMAVPAYAVSIDPKTPSTVYATARTQGVFRSSDGGHTWQPIHTWIAPGVGISAEALFSSAVRRVDAALHDHGLEEFVR